MSEKQFFKDNQDITILIRDINGRRGVLYFKDVTTFQAQDFNEYEDDEYEILLVEWGGSVIYTSLNTHMIHFEDLKGYFA